jgi:hypothetical protein
LFRNYAAVSLKNSLALLFCSKQNERNVAHLSNFTICYAEFRGIFTELLMAY